MDLTHPLITRGTIVVVGSPETREIAQMVILKHQLRPSFCALVEGELRAVDAKKILATKKLILFLIDDKTQTVFTELARLARRFDILMLPIFMPVGGRGAINVGPLIPPGMAENSNARYFEKLGGVKKFQVAPLRSALRDAIDLGTSALFPLLWEQLQIRGSHQRSVSMRNSKMAEERSSSAFFSIRNYLSPKSLASAKTTNRIERALKHGDLVSISDAFRVEIAEALYAALDSARAWTLNHDHFDVGFSYQHHNLYEPRQFPAALLSFKLIFENQFSIQFIESLTGENCEGPLAFGSSWYKKGDHSLPHSDHVGSRSVAYVWHLTKEWEAKDGGGLYWCATMSSRTASFNTLHLFRVRPDSWHFVTPVVKKTGKRLAINGWWTSNRPRRTKPPAPPAKPLDPAKKIWSLPR